MHTEGLLPLLAPAALAGHPGAVRALQAFVTGTSRSGGSNPRVRKAVLGRPREAATVESGCWSRPFRGVRDSL